jgi:hypothetical protein
MRGGDDLDWQIQRNSICLASIASLIEAQKLKQPLGAASV